MSRNLVGQGLALKLQCVLKVVTDKDGLLRM